MRGMELYEALRTRRTVHRYRRDALPEGAVDRALAAANPRAEPPA